MNSSRSRREGRFESVSVCRKAVECPPFKRLTSASIHTEQTAKQSRNCKRSHSIVDSASIAEGDEAGAAHPPGLTGTVTGVRVLSSPPFLVVSCAGVVSLLTIAMQKAIMGRRGGTPDGACNSKRASLLKKGELRKAFTTVKEGPCGRAGA